MLSGKKIYLRALEPSDADTILRWENNPDNWSVSNTLVPFSRKLIEDYVRSAQDIYSVKQVRFIICLIEFYYLPRGFATIFFSILLS